MSQYTRLNVVIAFNQDKTTKEDLIKAVKEHIGEEMEELSFNEVSAEHSSFPDETNGAYAYLEMQMEDCVNWGFLSHYGSKEHEKEMRDKFPPVIGFNFRQLSLENGGWDEENVYDPLEGEIMSDMLNQI